MWKICDQFEKSPVSIIDNGVLFPCVWQVSKAGYASQSKIISVTRSLDPDDVVILDFTLVASAAVPTCPSIIAIASFSFLKQLLYSVDNIFE